MNNVPFATQSSAASEGQANFFVIREAVREAMSMNLEGEWTEAVLFTPYEREQILMYENAECVAVRAFFKMAGLQFQLEQRPNAEFMSPTGKVPFLKLQKNLVAEFSPIVDFVSKKGIRLSSTLTEVEKADLQAHISMIEETLTNAEIYFTWQDRDTYRQVTKPRYASVFYWPLYLWMPFRKWWEMSDRLSSNEWSSFSAEEVLKQCDKCFQALSVKLGSRNDFFFGDQPTELDALAFGHLFTIITTELPDMRMADLARKYGNLIEFCKRINKEFFK